MSEGNLEAKILSLLSDAEDALLLKSITGMEDPERLAEAINTLCVKHFSSRVLTCYFARISMGASFGIKLASGSDIFLKINRLRSSYSDRGFSVDEKYALQR